MEGVILFWKSTYRGLHQNSGGGNAKRGADSYSDTIYKENRCKKQAQHGTKEDCRNFCRGGKEGYAEYPGAEPTQDSGRWQEEERYRQKEEYIRGQDERVPHHQEDPHQ